jgi:hypothetical protein
MCRAKALKYECCNFVRHDNGSMNDDQPRENVLRQHHGLGQFVLVEFMTKKTRRVRCTPSDSTTYWQDSPDSFRSQGCGLLRDVLRGGPAHTAKLCGGDDAQGPGDSRNARKEERTREHSGNAQAGR